MKHSPVLYEWIGGVWMWAQRINGEIFVGVADDVIVPPREFDETFPR